MDGATDAAETHYTLFHTESDDAPVRRGETRFRIPIGTLRQLQRSGLQHRPKGRHPGTGG